MGGRVLTLQDGNRMENIFSFPWLKDSPIKERYIVTYNPSKGNIYALLKDQAKSDDILKTAFHAHLQNSFGDKDLDLRLFNPLHLRTLLEDKRFSKCRLVLLHASYPFSKEASYLASVYSQVLLGFSVLVGASAWVDLLIAFQVLVKALVSMDPGDDTEFLKKQFQEFMAGLMSLPINIPRSRLHKSLQRLKVTITLEVISKKLHREIINKLVELYRESHLGKRQLAYDGRKSVYTAGPLPFSSKDFVIKLVDQDRGARKDREFKVSIKFAAKPDIHHHQEFMRGRQLDTPQETIQVLDVVLRATLSMNTDMSTRAFYEPILVTDFVAKYFNVKDLIRPLSDQECLKGKRALRGIKVELAHRKHVQCRRISGLSVQPTNQLTRVVEMGHFSSLFNGLARSFSIKNGRNSGYCGGSESAESMVKESKKNELILRSSGTVHVNGSNNFASVFSKRGEKGVNQDCFIVWEEFEDTRKSWRINSRKDMENYCFGKVLSHTDITYTLEIPSWAADLPEDNDAVMPVWDQGGRYWELRMTIRADQRKALKSKEWLDLAKANELEVGETMRFFYTPALNSYSVKFEGPNRVKVLQLFPPN
ncbi:unnamed protein product [Camellia sinensis]